MKNILIVFLLFICSLGGFAQTADPVTVANGVVSLKGKGKIGGIKDGAQWRRYKFARTGSFYLSAFFKTLTNSNQSFTGIALRNETTGAKTDGGIPMVGLIFENDTLKVKSKLTADTRMIDVVAVPSVRIGSALKIEKNNNDAKFYYSTSPANATTPVWTLITTIQDAFSGWTTTTQNFVTGTKLAAVQTATVSNIAFGAVTPDGTVSCSERGSFFISEITPNLGNEYKATFNAANLSSVNVDVKNSNNVSVKNYTTSVRANPLVIDIGTQTSGTYTLTFTGQSCSGTTTKTFVHTASTAPVLARAPLIVLIGESNAGTRIPLSAALSTELGLRSEKLKIYNPTTNRLERVNIPTNTSPTATFLKENDQTSGLTWGWELPLANAIDDGTITAPAVYIVKTAQGGAVIGQYNDDIVGGYFSTMKARIDSAKAQVKRAGYEPEIFVLYSLGLNNAIFQNLSDDLHFPGLRGSTYWKAATKTFLSKIRGITGSGTKIVMTKFWSPYSTYTNNSIDELVAENSLNYSVNTSSLTLQSDLLHFDASGQKNSFKLMMAAAGNFSTSSGTVVSPPTISSIPTNVVGNAAVTLTATGCTGIVSWFANGNLVTENTNTISYASATAGISYSAKCVVSGVVSTNSNYIEVLAPASGGTGAGNGATGLATAPAAIVIPEMNLWNYFYTDFPSITIPEKYDNVVKQNLPTTWFIWHSPFRNMFGYTANQTVTNATQKAENEWLNMKRLGINAIAWNFTKNCIENTYNGSDACNITTNQTSIDPAKNVVIGGSIETGFDPADAWGRSTVDHDFLPQASRARLPTIDNKKRGLAWIMDGENEYTAGIHQKDADHLGSSFEQVAALGDIYVGNLYYAANNGGGYIDDAYMAGERRMYSYYGTISSGTYAGKKPKDNPKLLLISEMATYAEDMLPQGYVLKDQSGADWFRINHFGTNVGVGIDAYNNGVLDNSDSRINARHVFTQYVGLVQREAKDAHADGHKFMISFKPNNQVGAGYMYEDRSKPWHNNKTAFEMGKWGAEYYNNPNQKQTAGDTGLPPYMGEGLMIACIMAGADGIYHWNSAWNPDLFPITKTGNARNNEHQVDATLDRVPREYYSYILKGQVRTGQKFSFPDNTALSLLDMKAEADTKYLNEDTEYSIDGGVTYKKINALGWQKLKYPPVLAVVNDRLKKLFIYTQEAYNECSSQGITSVKVRYAGNIYTVAVLPNNAPNLVGYSIPTVSQN